MIQINLKPLKAAFKCLKFQWQILNGPVTSVHLTPTIQSLVFFFLHVLWNCMYYKKKRKNEEVPFFIFLLHELWNMQFSSCSSSSTPKGSFSSLWLEFFLFFLSKLQNICWAGWSDHSLRGNTCLWARGTIQSIRQQKLIVSILLHNVCLLMLEWSQLKIPSSLWIVLTVQVSSLRQRVGLRRTLEELGHFILNWMNK